MLAFSFLNVIYMYIKVNIFTVRVSSNGCILHKWIYLYSETVEPSLSPESRLAYTHGVCGILFHRESSIRVFRHLVGMVRLIHTPHGMIKANKLIGICTTAEKPPVVVSKQVNDWKNDVCQMQEIWITTLGPIGWSVKQSSSQSINQLTNQSSQQIIKQIAILMCMLYRCVSGLSSWLNVTSTVSVQIPPTTFPWQAKVNLLFFRCETSLQRRQISRLSKNITAHAFARNLSS